MLVADEAHPIRRSSKDRFHPKAKGEQIFEMLDAAKVSVFLLDDNQVVRPEEVGTPELVRNAAEQRGFDFFEVRLEAQFRCSGSESYLQWLEWLLDLGGQPDLGWRGDYEFVVCDSPDELEERIRAQSAAGQTARLVAGFCWPWSDPRPDGSLVDDVRIESRAMPWNRRAKGSPPPDKNPSFLWASKPQGMEEVGCNHSAQGFEFDYCGVIFGDDLVWRSGAWEADKASSYDNVVRKSDDMSSNLRNTYRVLMSRGMKGTYVYSTDLETRALFEQSLTSVPAKIGV